MTLSGWADEIGLYRAIHRSTHSSKTIEGRLPSLRHAARYFGELGIAPQDVTRDQLIAYFDIEDERRQGAGPLVHWCNLRYFFDWLAREYDIPSPMARLKRPKPKHADAPHVFTPEERKAILAARSSKSYLDLRDTAIVRLLGSTGLRRAELLAMRRGDLDGRDSAPVRRGKGGKSRVVHFDAATALALRRYLVARDRRFPSLLDEQELLFVSRTGAALSYSGLGQMMARLSRDCGIHVRSHLFRHTWADAARRSGMNDSDIMELAGWSTGAMLRKYAAATAQERALEAARAHPVKVF